MSAAVQTGGALRQHQPCAERPRLVGTERLDRGDAAPVEPNRLGSAGRVLAQASLPQEDLGLDDRVATGKAASFGVGPLGFIERACQLGRLTKADGGFT